MDIWVVPTLGLLWIVLLWMFIYKSLCEHIFSFLLGIYLGVDLLHFTDTDRYKYIYSVLIFLGNAKLCSTTPAPCYIPTSSAQSFQFFHLMFSGFGFSCLFVFYDSHLCECEVVKVFNINEVQFICFFLSLPMVLMSYLGNLAKSKLMQIFPCVSCKSFTVTALKFRSLIHFEVILVCDVK